MKLRWNARADAVSTTVLWLGSLIAAIICIVWLAKNLAPEHISLQEIDNELTTLQRELNKACRMTTYWKNYYPRANAGNMIVNDMQICIDSSTCQVVYFQSASEPEFIGLDIYFANVSGCENLKHCSPYYYSGEQQPVFSGTELLLQNATTCTPEREPIVRCRLLTCYLNHTEYIELEELIYINITRDENATISFETH